MAYTAFADNKPVASDAGLAVINDTRNNLMAMRDAVVLGGMAGWDYAPTGGTAEQPDAVIYSKGTEAIKGTLTWGSSGGADGNVTQAVWAYSSNSGSTYPDAIGTEAVTYDSGGNVTAVTWS